MRSTQQKTLTSDLTADVLLSLKLRIKTEQQYTLLEVSSTTKEYWIAKVSSKMRITSGKLIFH